MTPVTVAYSRRLSKMIGRVPDLPDGNYQSQLTGSRRATLLSAFENPRAPQTLSESLLLTRVGSSVGLAMPALRELHIDAVPASSAVEETKADCNSRCR